MCYDAAMKTTLIAALVALLATVSASAQERTRLQVYTTLEVENIADFKKAFEAENRDIEIVWIRDATGVVTARVLAEQGGQQRADAVWGLAVTSMMIIKQRGLLEPYAPPTLGQLRQSFRDPVDPPSWVGMEGWVAAVCYNTIEGKKLGLAKPASWFDLTDPKYKGRITMPHPASSGTGYFHVSAWIQMFGEQKAWEFMDRLHDNIAQYVHSGSAPCKLSAMDFAASRKANELYATFVSQVAMPGVASTIPEYPAGVAESMIKNDFAWASDNRARILAEWTKRYEGKAAKH